MQALVFGSDAQDESKVDIMERIAPYFRPEFLNRFNGVIEFNHLSKDDLKKNRRLDVEPSK